MEVTTIGIDLAKSVFAVSCADGRGKLVVRKQLRRGQVLEFVSRFKHCVVGMEACGGAHHWARAIEQLGHEVRLMSPALVRPYRTGPKHDRNDADAICEAVRRPQMRYVAVKSVAQQDLLALHRVRAQLMKQRIALSNQLRALLHERGVVARLGAAGLRKALSDALAQEQRNEVSGAMGELLLELSGWLRELEQRVAAITKRIEHAAKRDERCARLMEVPGVGPLGGSALLATVGNARAFKRGRELSAYLGLTPRQHSSGGKSVMLGISKHGDRYLRTLLIHGARSLLYRNRRGAHPRAAWAARLVARRGANVAAIALANHNARLLWALLSRGDRYRHSPPPHSFPRGPPPWLRGAREKTNPDQRT